MAELEDDKEVSRRELLESAWDEAEKDESDTGSTGAEAKPEEAVDTSAAGTVEEGKTETEEGAKVEGGQKGAKSKEKRPDPDRQERKAAATEGKSDTKPDPEAGSAPRSWKPAVREHWASLPKDVRDTIATRELQIQQELTQTGNIRKFAQEFARVIEPYAHLIRANNSTPLKAIQNHMATAQVLYQGSSRQKAEMVAGIIGTYGIDITELDGILSAMQKNGGIKPGQGATKVEAPPAWAKPLFDFMGTAEQQRQNYTQRMQQDANAEVEKFDKPFFEDLREEMADLMEVAAARGKVMTLDEAYNRALALNPDTARVLQQRQAAAAAKAGNTQAAKRATSLIKGAPNAGAAGGSGGGKPANRRAAIAEAWDNASDG